MAKKTRKAATRSTGVSRALTSAARAAADPSIGNLGASGAGLGTGGSVRRLLGAAAKPKRTTARRTARKK